MENVIVHVATDDKIIRISKQAAGLAAAAQVLPRRPAGGPNRYGAKIIPVRMASGTSKSGHGKMRVIEIDYAKNPDLDPEM